MFKLFGGLSKYHNKYIRPKLKEGHWWSSMNQLDRNKNKLYCQKCRHYQQLTNEKRFDIVAIKMLYRFLSNIFWQFLSKGKLLYWFRLFENLIVTSSNVWFILTYFILMASNYNIFYLDYVCKIIKFLEKKTN